MTNNNFVICQISGETERGKVVILFQVTQFKINIRSVYLKELILKMGYPFM